MESVSFKNSENFTQIKTLPHFALVQSLTGNYAVGLNGGEEQITSEGGIFIAPPQCEQKITHLLSNGQMKTRWVLFNMEINNAYSAELVFDFPLIPNREDTQKLASLMDSLFTTEDICDRMSYCYQTAKVLLSSAKEKNIPYKDSLMDVLGYIKSNFASKITISDLASLVHISESNLYGSFKKQFGTSPISYLNNYRLVMASGYLKFRPSDSIEEISTAVGIDDVRYFSKIFKRKFNMTPSAYRKNTLI